MMSSHMLDEVALFSVSLVTSLYMTVEWSLSDVLPVMHIQGVEAHESLVADRTFVRTLSSVTPLMSLIVTVCGKPLLTIVILAPKDHTFSAMLL